MNFLVIYFSIIKKIYPLFQKPVVSKYDNIPDVSLSSGQHKLFILNHDFSTAIFFLNQTNASISFKRHSLQ